MSNIQKFLRIGILTAISYSYSMASWEFGENYRDKKTASISLIRLIASPEEFNNKRILTEGYIFFSGWEVYLFLREDDYKNRLYGNALRVDFVDGLMKEVPLEVYDQLNFSYIRVSGIYKKPADVHWERTSGYLKIDFIALKRPPEATKREETRSESPPASD